MPEETEFDQLVREMRQHFLAPIVPDKTFCELDRLIEVLDTQYQFVGQNFRHNLRSTLSSVRMPYELVSAGTQITHFQRIHAAARIRSLPISPEPSESDEEETIREQQSYQIALLEMAKFHESEQGRQAMIRDTCQFLLNSIKSENQKLAASELIRQGVVLIWSAFEILFRDAFELYLNLNPFKVELLSRHISTRKRFEVDRLSLDILIENCFNLSDKMGTVLVRNQDFSDLPLIKSVYAVLYEKFPELLTCLNQPDLWLLYQRRHLFVHRRGIVDERYLSNTGDAAKVGSTLEITPKAFNLHFDSVLQTGEALIRCFPSKSL